MELLYLDLMMVLPGEAAFAFVPYGSGQLALIGNIYLKGQVYELRSNNVCFKLWWTSSRGGGM
jgi:hypothetical protein